MPDIPVIAEDDDSFFGQLSNTADKIYDFITDPYGSKREIPEELSYYDPESYSSYDYTHDVRINNIRDGKLVMNPDRSPHASQIVQTAYNNVGKDIYRMENGKMVYNWVCTKAVCSIVKEAGMPWPADKNGVPTENNDWLIDAFRGKRTPGELFPESKDFIEISRDGLAAGDIIILDEYQGDREERDRSMRESGIGRNVTGKHTAIITAVFDDKIEIVHEGGEESPIHTKFWSNDLLDEQFSASFRYNPE